MRIGLALDCRDRAALAVPPQELLLPGHAEELPDLPVRPADLRQRAPRRRGRRARPGASASPGSTSRRTPGRPPTSGATGRIAGADYSLVDYNRAGVPLVEVVSEPDMRIAEEARAYLTELRAVLESLGVSDVRMEEGSLRCDANVSRPTARRRRARHQGRGQEPELGPLAVPGRALRGRAAARRAGRGRAADPGDPALRREHRQLTSSMRSKEYAFDYRYFPEPDLVPLEPTTEWVEEIRAGLPELPAERRARLESVYGLEPSQGAFLSADPETALRSSSRPCALGADPKAVANWVTGDLAGAAATRTGRRPPTRRSRRPRRRPGAAGRPKVIGLGGAKAALAAPTGPATRSRHRRARRAFARSPTPRLWRRSSTR